MRLPFLGILLGLSLLSPASAPRTSARQAYPQTCDATRQRTVIISALSKEGLPVDNLRADDLIISENKSERKILNFQDHSNEPLAIAVMIDTSVSQEGSLPGTKLAARAFVEKILRQDKDRVAVLSFTSEAIVEQDFTNDRARLLSALDRVKIVTPPGYYRGLVIGRPPRPPQNIPGSTAIWDSVWSAVDTFKDAQVRRAIVVLTDGDDTNSRRKMRDAVAHAAAANIAIFSIGIAGNYTLDRSRLRDLSDETGGLAFFPKKVSELDSVFEQITNSLKSRYVLSYCSLDSSPARKPLKLQISLKNPAPVQLSYPRYIL